RIAVVHDWCPDFRGGERVLARICSQFPNAEVFTLFDFLLPEVKEQYFRDVEFHASAAHRIPTVRRFYRHLFFFCPFLIEQFDVTLPEVKEQYYRDVEFHASAATGVPMVRRFYRHLFFFCPFLIGQVDVTGYDAVISSSAAFSRGVITRPDQPHLCYVHSPVR